MLGSHSSTLRQSCPSAFRAIERDNSLFRVQPRAPRNLTAILREEEQHSAAHACGAAIHPRSQHGFHRLANREIRRAYKDAALSDVQSPVTRLGGAGFTEQWAA